MLAGEYDAVITNFENTNFTAYYKKGISVKLSDNMTVITIYKPGALKKYKNQHYQQSR